MLFICHTIQCCLRHMGTVVFKIVLLGIFCPGKALLKYFAHCLLNITQLGFYLFVLAN